MCLDQAEQYFISSKKAQMIVKPLLLYYGAMALSTALILFLRDGNFRIEMLRQKYGRHGLRLKPVKDNKINMLDQLYVEEEGIGIFQIFRDAVGGDFVFAKRTKQISGGGRNYSFDPVLSETHESYRNIIVKTDASNLVSVYPDLFWHCHKYGCHTTLVRASIEITVNEDESKIFKMMVQPSSQQLIDSVMSKMKFEASNYKFIDVREFPSGFSLTVSQVSDETHMEFPPMYRDLKSNLFLSAKFPPIRQVCVLYLLLFVYGMYSRYYPEMWSHDIADGTENYLAAYDIIEVAHHSFPLFVLQEFEFEMYHANLSLST